MHEGRARWGGRRHRTRDKETTACAKFSVAGAQGTYGSGRAERAGTETGTKALRPLCSSYLSGDPRVSSSYFFTFSSTVSDLKASKRLPFIISDLTILKRSLTFYGLLSLKTSLAKRNLMALGSNLSSATYSVTSDTIFSISLCFTHMSFTHNCRD